MSNPGASKLQLLVLTGNPTIDSVIRYVLVAACAAAAGVITTWLNAHGFNDPNLYMMVLGAITSIVMVVAVALWGIIKASKNEAIVQLREAIAVQAGLNVAAHPETETPVRVTVDEAQTLIAQHATPVVTDRK
jgi:hypothetical protein